jgi:hypothetical protein
MTTWTVGKVSQGQWMLAHTLSEKERRLWHPWPPRMGQVSLAAEDAREVFLKACEEMTKPMITQKAGGLLSSGRSRSFLQKTYEKEENPVAAQRAGELSPVTVDDGATPMRDGEKIAAPLAHGQWMLAHTLAEMERRLRHPRPPRMGQGVPGSRRSWRRIHECV